MQAISCLKLNSLSTLPSGSSLETLKQVQSLAKPPSTGWLRAMRTGLAKSQKQVADQLTMTRQAYADLESAEARGAITLKSLHRAAAAMDCDLVYFIMPRSPAAVVPVAPSPQPQPTNSFIGETTDDLQTELK